MSKILNFYVGICLYPQIKRLLSGADPGITGGGGSRASIASDIWGGSGGFPPRIFFTQMGSDIDISSSM